VFPLETEADIGEISDAKDNASSFKGIVNERQFFSVLSKKEAS
jgi:hypothetical protein